jgi:epoxyqueuosine reductase
MLQLRHEVGEDPRGVAVLRRLEDWARELGFSQIGVAEVDLGAAEQGLRAWLEAGFHGSMGYMAAHGMKRARPAELHPGALRIITARMDYLPESRGDDWQRQEEARLARPGEAVISMYARGRDYHKVLRTRLQKLADRLADEIGPLGHRCFTDSAPVLEVELATRSGLGWRGKHTLALARDAGSMFFLGEIFVDIALPLTAAAEAHCGRCTACIDYLTIESDAAIPVEFRRAIGNRIYGCDDCQVACPWNKFARRTPLPDFAERAELSAPTLLALWAWSEDEFLRRTEGSPIRRIGHGRWQRNLAVALGNALHAGEPRGPIEAALRERLAGASPLLAEHIQWALSSVPVVGALNA